jgi:CRP-like cAMP-binding protein
MEPTPNVRYETGNRVIDGLPPADRVAVTEHLTMMTAEEASAGIARGEPITAVYFPVDAVFSVLVEMTSGDCYEVDTIGRRGLIGSELLFGAEIASRSVICQASGRFAQMPVAAFERHLAQLPSFATAVNRAVLLQSYRAQQTIACNFAHTLIERCARWILLTYDAIGRPEFTFRAEYLAMMLGVHTHTVAEPMGALQAVGAVRFADDVVSIVSERRLRDAACECFAVPVEYAQRLETRQRLEREAP